MVKQLCVLHHAVVSQRCIVLRHCDRMPLPVCGIKAVIINARNRLPSLQAQCIIRRGRTAQRIQRIGGQVVRADLYVLCFFDVVVCPDKEWGDQLDLPRFPRIRLRCLPEQLIIEAIRYTGLVITEEYNRSRLIRIREILDQLPDRLITLPDKREILIHLRILPCKFTGQMNAFFKIRRVDRVISAVVLHGDIEQEQRFVRLFVFIQFNHLLIVCMVADIGADALHICREVSIIQLLIKSEILINLFPVPRT